MATLVSQRGECFVMRAPFVLGGGMGAMSLDRIWQNKTHAQLLRLSPLGRCLLEGVAARLLHARLLSLSGAQLGHMVLEDDHLGLGHHLER